jgi:hypothetical protein
MVLFFDILKSKMLYEFRIIYEYCTDHATPLYPQNLALTSPTGGGRYSLLAD